MPKRPQDECPVDFQALFTAAPEPYLILDPELNIVTANDAYLRATVTSLGAIIGRHLFEVFPNTPDNARAMAVANLQASLERVLATGKPDTMPIQRYDIPSAGSGTGFEERYWSPVNTSVLDEQGDLIYLLHRVEDVTEFVRAREARAEQAALLEARTQQFEVEMFERASELQRLNDALRDATAHRDLVLDSVAEAIVALDSDWRITYLNDNAARQVEAERAELIGQVLWDLFPPGRTGALRRQLQEKMDRRQSGRFEHYNEASPRWTENAVYPMPDGLVLFSADVTERKQTELHLQDMRARLHSAIRVAQLGFWEMELESGIV
ncbi:PAS domain-containing protein [Pseudomonas sp. NP21570]|uniref:PAS domain-containing protein n=1 Tax=Stutzerimonas kunmingensis TaxID=1211807 RepID=UPI001E398B95|nr:PAS domain-containing protein [Stutzerimonas kunmingensis]MCB4797015.1 PAS domain-containing protein [Pseudomonas sp. NP21570]